MKVYFYKLDNGDWICCDEQCSTGDLWVDPAKINLLEVMLSSHGLDANPEIRYLYHDQKIHLDGFGSVNVRLSLYIVKGIIRYVKIYKQGGGLELATFTERFILDLPELPAFEPYLYPDSSDVADPRRRPLRHM